MNKLEWSFAVGVFMIYALAERRLGGRTHRARASLVDEKGRMSEVDPRPSLCPTVPLVAHT